MTISELRNLNDNELLSLLGDAQHEWNRRLEKQEAAFKDMVEAIKKYTNKYDSFTCVDSETGEVILIIDRSVKMYVTGVLEVEVDEN
jgi:hypothetical protein